MNGRLPCRDCVPLTGPVLRHLTLQLAQRFKIALKHYGLQKLPGDVDVSQFKPPAIPTAQSSLF